MGGGITDQPSNGGQKPPQMMPVGQMPVAPKAPDQPAIQPLQQTAPMPQPMSTGAWNGPVPPQAPRTATSTMPQMQPGAWNGPIPVQMPRTVMQNPGGGIVFK